MQEEQFNTSTLMDFLNNISMDKKKQVYNTLEQEKQKYADVSPDVSIPTGNREQQASVQEAIQVSQKKYQAIQEAQDMIFSKIDDSTMMSAINKAKDMEGSTEEAPDTAPNYFPDPKPNWQDKEAKMVPGTILDHLYDREGEVNKAYRDSLGKLTGGVGHLLTKEEQALYPEGTDIPKEVTDRWLEEDSVKAYQSAQVQAKDLGLVDADFIEALTSVNFQLGTQWYKKFPTAYKHLKNKDFDRAIKEIVYVAEGSNRYSDWHKQTPTRTTDFVDAIKRLT